MNNIISLKIDKKAFGDKEIFSNCKIDIKRGDFVTIYGESGIGKTTLLKMIGLIESFDGDYLFNGQPVSKKTTEKIRHKHFSYLFQEALLIPYLNVFDNIVLPLRNEKRKIDNSSITKLAKELNIEPLLNKKVTNLSGGEAIRVAIARALIADKDILVVDEPIGCLDEHNSKIVMNLIEKEHLKGKTIIMVSHSKEFEDMTNQIVIIKDKKIYAKENN